MLEVMGWLETSALAGFLRGQGIWTYGLLNLAHIIGIGSLFGAVLLLDLRLLGVWRSIPAASIIRPTVRLAAFGVLLAIASGIMMISFNTTEYHGNPFLYVKLPVLVAGLINVAIIQRLGAWRRAAAGLPSEPGDQKLLTFFGGLSLLIWMTVVSCGRMIGYW